MKINLKNIKAFVEGNTRMMVDIFGSRFVNLAPHIREQVAFRATICYYTCYQNNDKRCVGCGCSVPGKWYSNKACTDEVYPDLMDADAWEMYKEANQVDVDFSFLKRIMDEDI